MKRNQISIRLDEDQQAKLQALLAKYREKGMELRPVDIGRMALNRLFDQEEKETLGIDKIEHRTLRTIIPKSKHRCVVNEGGA